MPISKRRFEVPRCNSSTMRTTHHHFIKAIHKVGILSKDFLQVAFGYGLSKKKLTHEKRLDAYKNYLKDQAKYIASNSNKAYYP